MRRRTRDYQGVRSEGGLLPPDILKRLTDPKRPLDGLEPQDYGLHKSERLNDAVTQSWNRLQKHWRDFQEARSGLPEGEAATGLTNERWTLPLLRELGFGALPTGAGPSLNGRSYPIARFSGPSPIHLVGCGLSLDRRAAGQRGAAQHNPHGLVQEFLNRSDDHLWGVVCNGLRLRVLRDNQAMSRLSYLEFDLETIFDAEAYSDFFVLWLIAHATRFAPDDVQDPGSCWLERWSKEAEVQGTRALDSLRTGVEQALLELGKGFVDHPRNTALRDRLRSGALNATDLHAQLLRVVYRLIFLFVAEDRLLDDHPILHPPDDGAEARAARDRYTQHYSAARLRDMAGRITGTRHHDLWHAHQVVIRALHGSDDGSEARSLLALPALGSFLWDPSTTADLNDAYLTNHDFLGTLRRLAFTRQGSVLRPVDYRNLGSEELGSVYEGLLALTPEIGGDGHSFTFTELSGNERKTSGSYYTPTSLVNLLLDTALDPVIEDVTRGQDARASEAAILALKVCDPAVGSGHFLIGAAHRLARYLARARAVATGDGEASPPEYQRALRDVIGHCLYGVDLNPMAVELSKVALWLEALEPGKPLSFLDHHIKRGNSLLSADAMAPVGALADDGIPDEAYEPIIGDEPPVANGLKAKNKNERAGGQNLFAAPATDQTRALAAAVRDMDRRDEDSVAAVRGKESAYRALLASPAFTQARTASDLWCAAFFWSKRAKGPPTPTTNDLQQLMSGGQLPPAKGVELERLREEHAFFQWRLEFPDVFDRSDPGFDAVIGNPPWERVKLQEEEFFAGPAPEIANAKNAAARRRMIAELPRTNPALAADWATAQRRATAESRFLRKSGRYPLGGVGDVNTYAVFADLFRQFARSRGTAALILPNGLVTGFTYKSFLQELLRTRTLAAFYGFENEDRLFADVHNETKFGILVMNGPERPIDRPWFTAHLRQPHQASDPERRYSLTVEEIEAINPNTLTLPTFRWAKDAEVTAAIHQAATPLVRKHENGLETNPWGVRFLRMFDMANDSAHFLDHARVAPRIKERRGALALLDDGSEVYPLYEGKMFWHFDHRYGTYEGQTRKQANKGVLPHVDDAHHADPGFRIQPRYWVDASRTHEALGDDASREWFFAFRDVGPSERTFVGTVLPRTAAGHKAPLLFAEASPVLALGLCAMLSSLPVDYSARQRGSGMSYFIVEQLPVVAPETMRAACPWSPRTVGAWLAERAIELTYTSHEIEPLARSVGVEGGPFTWDGARRATVQADLDAAALHLFKLDRTQSEWLLDSFTVLRKYEERDLGEYRTKRLVLAAYDAIADAMRERREYVTPLDPAPGRRV